MTKTVKRLSIYVQHREVTITVSGSVAAVRKAPAAVQGSPAAVQGSPAAVHVRSQATQDTTGLCHTCNSPWVNVAAWIDGDPAASVDRIRYALEQIGLHLQVSPADQLQICQRSFQHLKENL